MEYFWSANNFLPFFEGKKIIFLAEKRLVQSKKQADYGNRAQEIRFWAGFPELF